MSVITLFLLGLYAYAIVCCIQTLECINTKDCTAHTIPLGSGIKEFLTTIGGLVSALVISVLAITPPTGSPAKTVVQNLGPTSGEPPTETDKRLIEIITYFYLGVWLAGGIAMVIWGMAKTYEKPLPELADAAKTWFGLAVAAAYAFFGLKPVPPGSNSSSTQSAVRRQ